MYAIFSKQLMLRCVCYLRLLEITGMCFPGVRPFHTCFSFLSQAHCTYEGWKFQWSPARLSLPYGELWAEIFPELLNVCCEHLRLSSLLLVICQPSNDTPAHQPAHSQTQTSLKSLKNFPPAPQTTFLSFSSKTVKLSTFCPFPSDRLCKSVDLQSFPGTPSLAPISCCFFY